MVTVINNRYPATEGHTAKGAGWLERMSGRVQQLICPQCQAERE